MAFFTSAINILQTLVVAIRLVWQFGELSISWKDMEMTILEPSPRESSSLWQVEVSF